MNQREKYVLALFVNTAFAVVAAAVAPAIRIAAIVLIFGNLLQLGLVLTGKDKAR